MDEPTHALGTSWNFDHVSGELPTAVFVHVLKGSRRSLGWEAGGESEGRVGDHRNGKDLDQDDRTVYFRLLRDLTYSLLHTDYEYDTIDDWVRVRGLHSG